MTSTQSIVHPDIHYLDPNDLVSQFAANNNEGVAIIDVRDADTFATGWIQGAENHPALEFSDHLYAQNVFSSHKERKALVVHCARSNNRGPNVARVLRSEKERYAAEHGIDQSELPEIKVLTGGYLGFAEKFPDSDLIQK